jgi:hypothetical protein
MRQGDEAFENVKQTLESQINEETMPLADKHFAKIVKGACREARLKLRHGLSELLKFDELQSECERFD